MRASSAPSQTLSPTVLILAPTGIPVAARPYSSPPIPPSASDSNLVQFFRNAISDSADRTISLLGNNDLRPPLQLRIILLVDFLAENKHHQVRILLNRSRLAQIRQLRTMIPTPRLSGARLNCESAITGTANSLASAFSPREIADTSCVRFSNRFPPPDINCK